MKMDSTVSFRDALRFWIKLGFISFGGPTGQIAIMHTELVTDRKWISESRFLHALNYCMLLPGPEAQQLAIYIGWLMHGALGGIVAGAFFVIPSIFILWGLSAIYVLYGKIFWIASFFYGLKAAVLAIVAAAVLRIGKKALRNAALISIAVLAFAAIFFLKVPFPWIILTAGLIGFVGGKLWPKQFQTPKETDPQDSVRFINSAKSSIPRAIQVLLICLGLWWTPVLLIGLYLGWDHTLFHEGLFFSKAAMVTFGGAYAVLPYVSQQAVEHFGWLRTGQMMDGLGLAETTPGPLIMVLQFVGFMGGWNRPGSLPPLVAATLGALITTWVTFVPCFLWIFLGAPHIEQLRHKARLSSALSAITAAVVGVVLNLAVWFFIHAIFPVANQVDWFLLVCAAIGFVGMVKLKWNMIAVVFASGLLGILFKYITGVL
ncbi:MAG: chromate transporter [Acidobacteria bacterium]|nr:MAG: chromate transporter [Acidobacteriota bacterium]